MTIAYLDNAATTWPKPPEVLRAVADAMETAGGNPGRGSHPLAEASAELLFTCRETAGAFFGAEPERVIFTSGATAALNIAIRGLARPGRHILYDNMNHNAIRRTVLSMAREGLCAADVYDASGDGESVLESIRQKCRPETGMIVATHQSNICSKVLPIREIGAFCRKRGLLFVVDAAQSAGHLPLDLEEDGISALAVPGHKGLYGPMGVGMLLLGPDVSPKPLLYGGAGIRSLDPGMPDALPERLEAGTLPLPAVAGLRAGMEWVRAAGRESIHREESRLAETFSRGIGEIGGFRIHGAADGSVVSFTHRTHTPAWIGQRLAEEGICVRTGFHCAPDAHRTLGTGENGTVRVSFSAMNRPEDVERILNVLRRLD